MPFKQILKELVDSTPHAVGAILVDWEGEAVQEYCHCEPYYIRVLAAHKGIIMGRLNEVQNSIQAGDVEDVVVTANGGHLIIGCVDPDYSLVMSINRCCPVALAMHYFRTAVRRCKKEI